MLSQYKDVFGKVGTGLHSYRVGNIAIVDVVFTVIMALILHAFFPKYSVLSILIGLFILGIIMHRLFGVRTTIDKLLF